MYLGHEQGIPILARPLSQDEAVIARHPHIFIEIDNNEAILGPSSSVMAMLGSQAIGEFPVLSFNILHEARMERAKKRAAARIQSYSSSVDQENSV